MSRRIPYYQIAPDAVKALGATKPYLEASNIVSSVLRELPSMDVDELETITPKKSFLEALMILGTGYFAIGIIPLSLFCLAVAKDVEVKPVGPNFDPMRFGTGFSIVLMILLAMTPCGLICAAVGRLVANTLFWQRIFLGFAIYYFLVLATTFAFFAYA